MPSIALVRVGRITNAIDDTDFLREIGLLGHTILCWFAILDRHIPDWNCLINLQEPVSGRLNAVVFAYIPESVLTQCHCKFRSVTNTVERLGERLRIVRTYKQSATGSFHNFNESTAARLNHGNPARHGLEKEHALRLVVRCRNGK